MGILNTIQNGKGSKPRPVNDLSGFVDNWDLIDWKKTDTLIKKNDCNDQEIGIESETNESTTENL